MKASSWVVTVLVIVLVALGIWWWNASAQSGGPGDSTGAEEQAEMNETADDENDELMGTDSPDVIPTITSAVNIEGMAFAPKLITVKKGTTVTWTNKDAVSHTVTADDKAQIGLDSPMLANGKTYSYTFDKVGTFTYHCAPHPAMKGTVIVTE